MTIPLEVLQHSHESIPANAVETPLERFLSETKQEIVQNWKDDLSKVNRSLDALEPSSKLPPIPSPIRGKDFVREPKLSALMRTANEYHNALIPEGKEKYIQFPTGATDKKLNTDAKDALEYVLIEQLVEGYGSLSWAAASKTTHFPQCEAIIRTAASSRDFVVYPQSSNYWCIRWLAEHKMNSKQRPSKVKRIGTVPRSIMSCQPPHVSDVPSSQNNIILSQEVEQWVEESAILAQPPTHDMDIEPSTGPVDVTVNTRDVVASEESNDANEGISRAYSSPAAPRETISTLPKATSRTIPVFLRLHVQPSRSLVAQASATPSSIQTRSQIPLQGTNISEKERFNFELRRNSVANGSATVTAPCHVFFVWIIATWHSWTYSWHENRHC
ncbi:hypothetical protein BWQ96_06601 [Gracilariopsis chorda]|uniref:Uncharacterized protein n=1 Tax=Gracilariopsis chorda TaxID=448386 RepID=A0A2V3INJ1_9FLOR|nr:hypothetical protein BWQ96_06601 [Gracilariopsis chorda]|eukprot:PXF43642.1 hypothetical protein BWQ96_06601 [Gracilariopsis chorda]